MTEKYLLRETVEVSQVSLNLLEGNCKLMGRTGIPLLRMLFQATCAQVLTQDHEELSKMQYQGLLVILAVLLTLDLPLWKSVWGFGGEFCL